MKPCRVFVTNPCIRLCGFCFSGIQSSCTILPTLESSWSAQKQIYETIRKNARNFDCRSLYRSPIPKDCHWQKKSKRPSTLSARREPRKASRTFLTKPFGPRSDRFLPKNLETDAAFYNDYTITN